MRTRFIRRAHAFWSPTERGGARARTHLGLRANAFHTQSAHVLVLVQTHFTWYLQAFACKTRYTLYLTGTVHTYIRVGGEVLEWGLYRQRLELLTADDCTFFSLCSACGCKTTPSPPPSLDPVLVMSREEGFGCARKCHSSVSFAPTPVTFVVVWATVPPPCEVH